MGDRAELHVSLVWMQHNISKGNSNDTVLLFENIIVRDPLNIVVSAYH